MAAILSLFAALISTGCLGPRALDGTWVEVSTKHFELMTDDSPEAALRNAKRLEQFRAAALAWAGLPQRQQGDRVRIILFRDYTSFEDFEWLFRGDGYFVRRMSEPIIAVNAGTPDGGLADLYHELTHFFLYLDPSRQFPLWYQEGLASVLSTAKATANAVRIGDRPQWAVGQLRHGLSMPIAELLEVRSIRHQGVRMNAFYADSWALIHYLRTVRAMEPFEWNSAVSTYLHWIRNFQPVTTAFALAFREDPVSLTESLPAYVLADNLPTAAVEFKADAKFLEGVEPRLLSRDEVAYRLADLQAELGPDWKERAISMAEEAIRQNSNHARAHSLLGTLKYGQAPSDEVLAHFERALELSPGDPRIRSEYGRYLIVRAQAEFELGCADRGSQCRGNRRRWLHQGRVHLGRGLELDPDAPDLHYWLGLASLIDGRKFKAGTHALEKAAALAPWSPEIRIRLAEIYLRQNKTHRARLVLQGVASTAPSEEQATRVRELLEAAGVRSVRPRALQPGFAPELDLSPNPRAIPSP